MGGQWRRGGVAHGGFPRPFFGGASASISLPVTEPILCRVVRKTISRSSDLGLLTLPEGERWGTSPSLGTFSISGDDTLLGRGGGGSLAFIRAGRGGRSLGLGTRPERRK